MQSSRKHAIGITSSGLAVTRARSLLRLALGLLVAVVSVLWLVLGPVGVAPAERASGYAGLARSEASLARGSTASTGTVIVNLNPSSASAVKDQIFTVDIQIVAGAQPVDAAQISLYFDQTYLQVVDADASMPGVQIEDLSYSQFHWMVITDTVHADTEPAWILFSSGYLASGTKPSGTFSLARIHFKALRDTGGGSTPLEFGTVGGGRTEILYGSNSVLGGVENGSVTISGETPTVTPTSLMRRVFLPVVIRQR